MKLEEGVYPVGPDEGERLIEVWEASVRATHDFLSESDIAYLKPLVLPALRGMENLCRRARRERRSRRVCRHGRG